MKPRGSSPSAARVAAAKASSGLHKVAASNRHAFVAAKKESFSVTNQPKLKYGNVAKDLQRFGFKVLGPIAAGAFSTIVRAKRVDNGREVAIKTFASCEGATAEEHGRELDVLRLLSDKGSHPNIASLLGEHVSPQGATHAELVYCGGGSLNIRLAKLRKSRQSMPMREAALVTHQVASGIAYLHGRGVAHRDVKPANLLYDGERWRLCDFGFACVCGDDKLRDCLGTPAYSAPELLLPHSCYIGSAVDMWAFGVVMFEMLAGTLPFATRGTAADLGLRIHNGFAAALKNGSSSWPNHVTGDARALVGALLSKEAAGRPSAEDVASHSWVAAHVGPTGELLPEPEAPRAQSSAAGAEAKWRGRKGRRRVEPEEEDGTPRAKHSDELQLIAEA